MSRKAVLIVLGAAVLLLAGVVSSFADPNPDGLEAATVRGCEVAGSDTSESLAGDCPAIGATDHALATSPLADYAVAEREGTTGVAGIVGAVATLVFAAGLFMVLARRRKPARSDAPLGKTGP
jgi:cobalt/nickel transport protein